MTLVENRLLVGGLRYWDDIVANLVHLSHPKRFTVIYTRGEVGRGKLGYVETNAVFRTLDVY